MAERVAESTAFGLYASGYAANRAQQNAIGRLFPPFYSD